jgi:hypothetical protein
VDGLLAAPLAGQDLVGARGDHLIGIHIGLCAGPGLPDNERKLIVMRAGSDFPRGLLDDLGQFGIEPAQPGIHTRRRLLHETQRMHDLDRHDLAWAEREIVDGALRLRAPVAVAGNVDRPEAVGFGAGGHHSILRAFAKLSRYPVRVTKRPVC